MAEWPKAAVLKTVDSQGSVGSNPTPSANTCNACLLAGGVRTHGVRPRGPTVPEGDAEPSEAQGAFATVNPTPSAKLNTKDLQRKP